MPTLQSILAHATRQAAGASLREMLSDVAARIDQNSPTIRQQIEEIDLAKMRPRVERMIDRAAIIAHSFDVMEQGAHPHPLAAFLHACECLGPVSDEDFAPLLTIWSRVCSECLKPEELTHESLVARAQADDIEALTTIVTVDNYRMQDTDVLKRVHRVLPDGTLRSMVAGELMFRNQSVADQVRQFADRVQRK